MNETTTSETIRILDKRGSIRNYKADPVSDDLVSAVLGAAQRAPTSANVQAYSYIVVRDGETRRQLSEVAGGQAHIAQAPVFLAYCADLTGLDLACRMHGQTLADETFEMGLVATIDAALTGMCASLAAESLGLGSVMIGAMRNDPAAVARILGLPPKVYVVFGMCLGWPAAPATPKPRIPVEGMVHFERYDTSDRTPYLRQYDQTLQDHYDAIGKPTHNDAWTLGMAERFSTPRRADLRGVLKDLGFEFS